MSIQTDLDLGQNVSGSPVPASPPRDPAVLLQGVAKAFGATPVLRGIDLLVESGQFVALLGPSGTGKTTLLRLLAGLERPDAGLVRVPAAHTTVYQEPRLIPAHRVLRNVMLGQRRTTAAKQAALAALAEVGLADKARAWPATLSGGQAQRVALARALVRKPRLMLLDEPFASLDAQTRHRMHGLLDQLRAQHNPAIVMVTHDVDEAIRLADRIVMIQSGKVSLDLALDPELGPSSPPQPGEVARLELRAKLFDLLDDPAQQTQAQPPASTERIPHDGRRST